MLNKNGLINILNELIWLHHVCVWKWWCVFLLWMLDGQNESSLFINRWKSLCLFTCLFMFHWAGSFFHLWVWLADFFFLLKSDTDFKVLISSSWGQISSRCLVSFNVAHVRLHTNSKVQTNFPPHRRNQRQTRRSTLRPEVDVSAGGEADLRPPHRLEVPLHGLSGRGWSEAPPPQQQGDFLWDAWSGLDNRVSEESSSVHLELLLCWLIAVQWCLCDKVSPHEYTYLPNANLCFTNFTNLKSYFCWWINNNPSFEL